ncbi:hypothetical protein DM558_00455 [Entomomonas moraniae]|uniref:Uncharacterized protein n=1 Tax=Entomomonas moraniae TaxID=2213226 RepID=A0A3Q9JJ76_9GAMM|nr:hypothetical protein [Entomomonas moraniae]AZS49340.1 hypothetical protein DM558_00455 [Entomomonas moraniae]
MPVIPKGDNFGNAQIRVGRTNLQGDNGAVGRAMAGLGREVMGVGLKLQQEKEQKRKSLNRVSMANGAMEYQQQVNEVLKNVNEQVNSGQLPPEKARQKTQELISNIDTQAFRPNDLDEEESAVWGLNINKINNGADLEATGVEEKGVKLKAQTDINKLITNAKANNYNPEQVQQMLNSEDVKKTGTLVWGLASQENLKSLGRSYTTDYLQNEITTAADKGDYKALKKIKSDIQNQEYHKDWVLSDDRVRLIHGTNSAMKRLESEWKAAQAESLVNLQYKIQDDSAKIEAGLDVPDPLTEDQIKAARPSNPAARERFDRQIQSYRETLQLQPVLVDVVRGTPKEALTAINSIKPNANDENFALKQQRYNFVMSRYQQTLQAREKDPAGWLVQNNESVQKAFQAYTEDSANGAAFATAVEAQKQIYGISSDKLLPENVNNALIKQIEKNPTVSNIRSISASFGQYAPKILGQIQSKGGDAIAVAVGLEDEQASDLLLKHKDIPIKDIAKTISKTDYDIAIKGLSDNISAARTSFAMQPDGLKPFSAINSQLEKLAVIYTTKGMSPAEAAKKAAESINNQYDFNDTWRVPKHLNLNSSDIEDGAAYYVKTLKTNYISPFSGDNRLGNAVLLKQTLSRIQSNAEFITNKDETGLILTVDGIPVRDDKGNLIDISYTSLSIMGREHRSNWRIDARAEQSKFLAKKTTQEEKDAVFYKALEASLYTP